MTRPHAPSKATREEQVLTEIGTTEQAARDREVIRARRDDSALSMLIRTRAGIIKDEPPAPDLQVARDAIRDARTRQAWASWHRGQAERHRATLTDLVSHHEAEARRLMT